MQPSSSQRSDLPDKIHKLQLVVYLYSSGIMSLFKEFLDFMREYKILAMAIAFIMGIAATGLVKSFVDNLIMPWVNVLTPSGNWQEAVLSFGPVALGIGPFAAELLNFIIIAVVVFLIAKFIMKEEIVSKK